MTPTKAGQGEGTPAVRQAQYIVPWLCETPDPLVALEMLAPLRHKASIWWLRCPVACQALQWWHSLRRLCDPLALLRERTQTDDTRCCLVQG